MKNFIRLSTYGILVITLFTHPSCSPQKGGQEESQEKTDPVTESESQEQENSTSDWVMLFDGASTDQWRNYQTDTISTKWQVEEGTLTLTEKGGGDIITMDQYENFELELEWKISQNGNSGLFFHVVEADTLATVWRSGPEYQILDNDGHPDAKIEKHRAGDNYDLQACSEETVKPAGEWNQTKLKVNQGKVEHWLNDVKVVEYELWTDEWKQMVAESKFRKMPMYGMGKKGHIALQDHGDKVWFRNIRIREL